MNKNLIILSKEDITALKKAKEILIGNNNIKIYLDNTFKHTYSLDIEEYNSDEYYVNNVRNEVFSIFEHNKTALNTIKPGDCIYFKQDNGSTCNLHINAGITQYTVILYIVRKNKVMQHFFATFCRKN